MGYRVDYTEYGEASRDNAIEYLLYKVGGTGNPQAAINLMNEIDRALDILEKMPESFPICEHKYLHAQGIRKIHLKRMAYKIFYHIESDLVIIDAFLHDKQDYENILS